MSDRRDGLIDLVVRDSVRRYRFRRILHRRRSSVYLGGDVSARRERAIARDATRARTADGRQGLQSALNIIAVDSIRAIPVIAVACPEAALIQNDAARLVPR